MLHKPVRPAVLFKHLNAALHRREPGPGSPATGPSNNVERPASDRRDAGHA